MHLLATALDVAQQREAGAYSTARSRNAGTNIFLLILLVEKPLSVRQDFRAAEQTSSKYPTPPLQRS